MRKISFLFLMLANLLFVANAQNSDKISRVIEYRPAPGQHINRLFPTPAMSDTYENALEFANNTLVGKTGSMLGLGAFGGYVIVAFDHPVVNVGGEYDFKILGNAMSGSSEPGVVMVCQDLNKNGVPDEDELWYELAGSEYNNPETIKNYEITYYRPEGNKQAVRWTDNQGNEGTIKHISFATQNYMYPIWEEARISFSGTKLPKNARDTNGMGTNWALDALGWGYADNHQNTASIDKIGFNIDWAVNEKGEPVNLEYIDFIKIHTGQVQEAGWLGETSTEITGVVDLHPNAVMSGLVENTFTDLKLYVDKNTLWISGVAEVQSIKLYNLQGILMRQESHVSNLDVTALTPGVYVAVVSSINETLKAEKIIIK